MFWEPSDFAVNSGQLAIWQVLLLMWAVCSGVIHGVGFRPRYLRWRAFFAPLSAFIILLVGIIFSFISLLGQAVNRQISAVDFTVNLSFFWVFVNNCLINVLK